MIIKNLKKGTRLFILIMSFSCPGFAALDDFEIVSWNMQGSNASTESKWRGNIIPLILGGAEIILLQEAGQVPATAMTPTGRQFNTPITVTEHIWNIQTRSRPRNLFIYFINTDPGGNRVNMAIVSRVRADDAFVLTHTAGTVRPAMGIRIGMDAFFTIHAGSPGGNDAPRLINAVSDFFTNNADPDLRNVRWFVGGDFNRSPDSFRMALDRSFPRTDVEIIRTNQPTQSSGGELDYAVVGGPGAIPASLVSTLFFAERLGQIASDHTAVGFYSTSSR